MATPFWYLHGKYCKKHKNCGRILSIMKKMEEVHYEFYFVFNQWHQFR